MKAVDEVLVAMITAKVGHLEGQVVKNLILNYEVLTKAYDQVKVNCSLHEKIRENDFEIQKTLREMIITLEQQVKELQNKLNVTLN